MNKNNRTTLQRILDPRTEKDYQLFGKICTGFAGSLIIIAGILKIATC